MQMRGILGLLLVVGCQSAERTEFPPGLEPLEENLAPPPAESGGADELSVVTGERDGHNWGHARMLVRGTPAVVYAALLDPDVVVNRRESSEWSAEVDVEPEYDASYLMHVVIERVVTVEYDQLWRFGILEGTAEAPELVMARYQKVYGSSFIELLEGSVMVRELSEGLTEVEVIQHLGAIGSDPGTIETYFRDFRRTLDARVAGEPLPTF